MQRIFYVVVNILLVIFCNEEQSFYKAVDLFSLSYQVEKRGDKELGERIKRKRKEYGLSQSDLAVAADCSIRNISKIETAVVNPSYGVLKKIIREGFKITEIKFYSD